MVFDLVYKRISHLTNPIVNGIILTIVELFMKLFYN
jgi:hypothetical protein